MIIDRCPAEFAGWRCSKPPHPQEERHRATTQRGSWVKWSDGEMLAGSVFANDAQDDDRFDEDDES